MVKITADLIFEEEEGETFCYTWIASNLKDFRIVEFITDESKSNIDTRLVLRFKKIR